MNRRTFLSILITIFILTSCSPSDEELLQQIAIAAAETERSYTQIPSNTPYATYTPFPTYTSPPTQTPFVITITNTPTLKFTPTETATQTPPPGIGAVLECGPDMTIEVLEPPDTRMKIYSDRATGVFMVLKLELFNLSNRTWDGLEDESFHMKGTVEGKDIIFAVNGSAASHYASGYGWQDYEYDDIQPGLSYRTYIVFDVNPAGSNWVLQFNPSVYDWDNGPVGCNIEIPIVEELPVAW